MSGSETDVSTSTENLTQVGTMSWTLAQTLKYLGIVRILITHATYARAHWYTYPHSTHNTPTYINANIQIDFIQIVNPFFHSQEERYVLRNMERQEPQGEEQHHPVSHQQVKQEKQREAPPYKHFSSETLFIKRALNNSVALHKGRYRNRSDIE